MKWAWALVLLWLILQPALFIGEGLQPGIRQARPDQAAGAVVEGRRAGAGVAGCRGRGAVDRVQRPHQRRRKAST